MIEDPVKELVKALEAFLKVLDEGGDLPPLRAALEAAKRDLKRRDRALPITTNTLWVDGEPGRSHIRSR